MPDLDLTRSKRTPTVVNDQDVKTLQDTVMTIGENMRECQEFALSVLGDKGYTDAVALSHARFIDLFEKDCLQPMTAENLHFHAEMRGRMSERLRLTLELEAVKSQTKIFESMYLKAKKRLAQLVQRRGEKEK